MRNSEKKSEISSILFSLFLVFFFILSSRFYHPSFYLSRKSGGQVGGRVVFEPIRTLSQESIRISNFAQISQGEKERTNQTNLLPKNSFGWFRDYSIQVPKISAKSALIFGLNDDYLFFQREPSKVLPIASLTKLMTALVVYESLGTKHLSNEIRVKISKESEKVNHSFYQLENGEIFGLRDIVQLMLTVSSNQAALSIAQTLSGSENPEKFVEAMNNKAKKLGLFRTHFSESTGLSSRNRSTAFQIAKLTKYIFLNYSEIFSLQKVQKKTICSEKICHHLINIDLLVKRKDFLGGKTGYTDEAGGCLVSIFKWKEPVVIIVLNSKDRFRETEELFKWLKMSYH